MIGFYDDQCDEGDITRDDIAACDDAATLKLWMRSLDGKEQSIKADIDARIEAGTHTTPWLVRASQALAYTKMGKAAVRRRMKELGCDESQNGEVQRLHREVALAKANAAYAKHFVQAAKDLLSPDMLAKIGATAVEMLNDAEAA